jgi:CYTH domain
VQPGDRAQVFAPPDGAVPDLSDLPGVVVESRPAVTLEATYLDSADLRLLRSNVTLRIGSAGGDVRSAHQAPGSRRRVGFPPGDPASSYWEAAVPRAVSRLLVGLLRGDAELRPVARITTRRQIVTIEEPSGEVLAEVADDHVTARRLAGGGDGSDGTDQAAASSDGDTIEWREIEVEVKAGGPELLDAVERIFARAGVTRSAGPTRPANSTQPPCRQPAARSSGGGSAREPFTGGQAWPADR